MLNSKVSNAAENDEAFEVRQSHCAGAAGEGNRSSI